MRSSAWDLDYLLFFPTEHVLMAITFITIRVQANMFVELNSSEEDDVRSQEFRSNCEKGWRWLWLRLEDWYNEFP
jgi:hypothetical protein